MSLIRGTSKADDGTPDATLVDRARRGHPEAFEALVRRPFRKAYTVALAVLSNGCMIWEVSSEREEGRSEK